MQQSLPPISNNGVLTCPDGYVLSPDGSTCLPIVPPTDISLADVKAQEINPANAAQLSARGIVDSGIIDRIVAMVFTAPINLVAGMLAVAADVFDRFLAALGGFFFAAQGQRNAGYYILVAELFKDLTGIEVDGNALFQQFQAGGRVSAMTGIGSALFNALASEFVGNTQPDAGNAWKVSPGDGVGGLPSHQYAPGDGVKAGEALLGFAASFAVREGNTDMLADYVPWGLGHWFKDFAEDFSKSIGLGRLMRVALRPLMQIMVADPLTADLNTQYRPKLLSVPEILRATGLGIYSEADRDAELAMLGYSDTRIKAVLADVGKYATVQDWYTLLANRSIDSDTLVSRMLGDGYTPQATIDIPKALDLAPARHLSIAYLNHYMLKFLEGQLSSQAIGALLDGIEANAGFLLTRNEVEACRALITASTGPAARPRHLSVGQLQLAYIDGTISLDELENHLLALGYSQADVTVLALETLIKAQQKQAAAAKKASTGKTTAATPASALNAPSNTTPGPTS